MNDSERGKIHSPAKATRIRDFSGLRYGLKTGTDLDFFLDYEGKAFVFIELKYGDADIKGGQEWAFERLRDACQKGGIRSLFIIASHNVPEKSCICPLCGKEHCSGDEIIVHSLQVKKFRCDEEKPIWRKPRKPITVKEACDKWVLNKEK